MSLNVKPIHHVPPKKVTDLTAETADYNVRKPLEGEIGLTWTAPEPNTNKVGTYTDPYIKGFLIRWNTLSIDGQGGDVTTWWNNAAGVDRDGSVGGEFSAQSGEQMSFSVDSDTLPLPIRLSPKTTYYFAVKTIDLFGNESYVDVKADPLGEDQAHAVASCDNIAPNAINNLVAVSTDTANIVLSWTAPGDDGTIGNNTINSNYIVRYATYDYSAIGTNAWWNSAATQQQLLEVSFQGITQQYAITGLQKGTTYWYAVKTVDDRGNVSDISNMAFYKVWGDIISPEAIADLVAYGIYDAGLVEPQIRLSWTAPHENEASGGKVISYEIRFATFSNLGMGATTWWSINASSPIDSALMPEPLDPGEKQVIVINSWMENPGGINDYFYPGKTSTPAKTYWFAIKSTDIDDCSSDVDVSTPQAGVRPQIDVTPPYMIEDLMAAQEPEDGKVELSWTMPGDDGSALNKYYGGKNDNWRGEYDIRYSTLVIVSSGAAVGEVNFDDAPEWDYKVGQLLEEIGEPMKTTISALKSDTTYWFAIKTADEVYSLKPTSDNRNWSEMSNVEIQVTADYTPPVPPTGLTAMADIVGNVINLEWTAPDKDENGKDISLGNDLAKFRVYRATDSFYAVPQEAWAGSGYIQAITTLAADTTTYTDATALGGTTYYYIVTAIDNSVVNENESGPSNEAWASLEDFTAPVPVTDLLAMPGENKEGVIELSWTSPYDTGAEGRAEKYYVRYATFSIASLAGDSTLWWSMSASADISDVTPAKSSGTIEILAVTGLTPNVTYWFALKSEDSSGNTSFIDSTTPQASASASGMPPGPVNDLTARTPTEAEQSMKYSPVEGKIVLTWSAPYDDDTPTGGAVNGYIIKYADISTESGFITPENWWNLASSITFNVPVTPKQPGETEEMVVLGLNEGMTPGTTYYFAIRSIDEYGSMSPLDYFTVKASSDSDGDIQAHAYPQYDQTPPTMISTLEAKPSGETATTVVLSWDATGDDYMAGLNAGGLYEIGYSTHVPVNSESGKIYWWTWQTENILVKSVEKGVGAQEVFSIIDLRPESKYYFIIRVRDERFNWSGLSNIAEARTSLYKPLDVTGLRAYFENEDKFVITWSKVDENTERNDISNVVYEVYRTKDYRLGNAWTGSPIITTSEEKFTDTKGEFDKYTYYYRIVAKDVGGEQESEFSAIIDTDINLIYLVDESNNFARIVVPEEINSALYGDENEYKYDIKLKAVYKKNMVDEDKDVQTAYEFQAYPYYSEKPADEVTGFNFTRSKAEIVMPYESAGVSAMVVRGSQLVSAYSIYYFNGKEGIKIGGEVSEPESEILIEAGRLGIFMVKEDEQETTVGLKNVYPKTFTPNGDGYNDRVNFVFSNPDNDAIYARIYDLKGAEVRIISEGDFTNALYWDGMDANGYVAKSGIYIYQIEIGEEMINGTVVLAK